MALNRNNNFYRAWDLPIAVSLTVARRFSALRPRAPGVAPAPAGQESPAHRAHFKASAGEKAQGFVALEADFLNFFIAYISYSPGECGWSD